MAALASTSTFEGGLQLLGSRTKTVSLQLLKPPGQTTNPVVIGNGQLLLDSLSDAQRARNPGQKPGQKPLTARRLRGNEKNSIPMGHITS